MLEACTPQRMGVSCTRKFQAAHICPTAWQTHQDRLILPEGKFCLSSVLISPRSQRQTSLLIPSCPSVLQLTYSCPLRILPPSLYTGNALTVTLFFLFVLFWGQIQLCARLNPVFVLKDHSWKGLRGSFWVPGDSLRLFSREQVEHLSHCT